MREQNILRIYRIETESEMGVVEDWRTRTRCGGGLC